MNGVSIIIPAYNEEKYLPETLRAVNEARSRFLLPSEVIVIDNASTDKTAAVALDHGARVEPFSVRNISAVRNAGIRAAKYDLVISIDADCGTPPEALNEIHSFMLKGKHIGGGLGLKLVSDKRLTRFIVACVQFVAQRLGGIQGAVFFFLRDEALAAGGFDEKRLVAEDSVFALTMKNHAQKTGRGFGLLTSVVITTIDRKETSVWTVLKNIGPVLRAFRGKSHSHDELTYWYDPKR